MKKFLLIMFLLSSKILFSQNGWFWQNPKPVANILTDIEFITAEIGYAAGQSGAIIKTTDGGENWIEQDCGYSPFALHIDLTGVSFIDVNNGMMLGRIYWSVEFHHFQILKTTNGGSNWLMVYTSLDASDISSIEMIDENHAFAYGAAGYLKTTDGGLTWDQKQTPEFIRSLSFSDPNNGSAATQGGILRTSDGGDSWVNQYPLPFLQYLNCIKSFDSLHIIAAGSNGLIVKTTNGGNNWIQQSSGTTETLIDMSFSDTENGTMIGDSIILRTTDGGINWGIQHTGSSVPYFAVSFGDANKGTILGGNWNSDWFQEILHTDNGGLSWYSQYSTVTRKTLQDIFFTDENTGIAVGDNGTILKTFNGGQSWVIQESGTQKNLNGLFFSNSNTGIVVGDSGLIMRTTDGGKSWNTQNIFTYQNLTSVYFVNGSNTGFVTGFNIGNNGYNGIILKTTDGGSNWSINLDTTGYFNDVFFVNESRGVVVGRVYDEGDYVSGIFTTTNGGEKWILTYKGLPYNDGWSFFKSVYFSDSYSGTAVGGVVVDGHGPPIIYGYFIYNTTDGGLTWNSQAEGSGFILNDVSFFNNMNGLAVGKYAITSTTDGGENWNIQYSNGGVELNCVSILNSETSIAAGYYGAILKSTNTGLPVELSAFYAEIESDKIFLSWQTASEANNMGFEVQRKTLDEEYQVLGFIKGHGTSSTIKDYNYSDKDVQSGTYTYRLKQIDFDQVYKYSEEVEIIFSSSPKQFSLEQCYPNPFNPETVISFSLPEDSPASLKIFDILGNEIAVLLNQDIPKGNHEVKFNASVLPSGIYFYTLQAADFSQTRKMILMK
jgi:photosystem II stability/assembly factor-like uncharacterized protein